MQNSKVRQGKYKLCKNDITGTVYIEQLGPEQLGPQLLSVSPCVTPVFQFLCHMSIALDLI